MQIHADLSQRAEQRPQDYHWVASPAAGVERMMLDRMGEESGRATTLVRFAKGASFPRHQHPGGEEILVLEGSFNEGSNLHPKGWYMRNPPGSWHQPDASDGALIFVKLCQMQRDDRARVRINTNDPNQWRTLSDGAICPLFDGPVVDCSGTAVGREQVLLRRLHQHAELSISAAGGRELLVLQGALCSEQQGREKRYPSGSWIRLPAGDTSRWFAHEHNTAVFVKSGHLVLDGAVS
ncbi:cupin domain-containing protein [Oceanobacter kriegii]|uniref:cupin domain-containing protein n=1 Tax=Oceanobacter kriegii TaxID=64972 RepID=UPI000412EF94|nr:cupin domain-containing protein [Oceanobacter kriegii]